MGGISEFLHSRYYSVVLTSWDRGVGVAGKWNCLSKKWNCLDPESGGELLSRRLPRLDPLTKVSH